MKPRKLPPVRHVRTRKGNHPSNPYAGEAATALPLEPRRGPPPPVADLSDEAQLGALDLHDKAQKLQPLVPQDLPRADPGEDEAEPAFWLPASDPWSGITLRFWANARKAACQIHPAEFEAAHDLAARMDAWRKRHSRVG